MCAVAGCDLLCWRGKGRKSPSQLSPSQTLLMYFHWFQKCGQRSPDFRIYIGFYFTEKRCTYGRV